MDQTPIDPLTAQLRGRPRPPRVSACVIARDAAATIAATLQSLRFCEQIIVIVDAATTDNTEAVARSLANEVERRPWEGFARARAYALGKAAGEWVLMIDADEVVTPPLAQSIIEAVTRDQGECDGFLVRRRTRFLGRFLAHGDWGRDVILRLVRRSRCEINDALIHESLKNPGRTRILDGLLLHEGERTIEEHLARQNLYTTLAARQMLAQGRSVSALALALKPPFRFLRSYILRLGFLDGWPGFVQAWYSAVYVFTRYAKLGELRRRAGTP
ncbi:MAG TPA: glycosyltransferase family 2 protein [bacterium]|nr:glycosyltransferase family 2 protein [bacterium]